MLRHRLPPLAPDHVRSPPGGVWLDLCIEAHLPGRPCPGAPPPDPWRSVIFRVVDTRIREEVADAVAAAVAAHSVAAEASSVAAVARTAMALATQAEASQPGEPAGDGGRGSQEPECAPGPQAEAAVPAPEGEPAEGSRPAKAARLA